MIIEILYPEFCNLYGDSANVKYLEKTCIKAKFIKTALDDVPYFINNKVDLIYMGSISESHQELIIKKLLPYKKELIDFIEKNNIILATGNSFEIFGKYILDNEKKIKCLDMFDYYAIRDFNHRHNSLFLGEFNDIKIVGNKSSFSTTIRNNNQYNFIKVSRGVGLNKDDLYEGIKYKNFYGTYLLGPLLVINPYFCKYLLEQINYNGKIAFEKEAIDAYEYKLKELEDPNTTVVSKH